MPWCVCVATNTQGSSAWIINDPNLKDHAMIWVLFMLLATSYLIFTLYFCDLFFLFDHYKIFKYIILVFFYNFTIFLTFIFYLCLNYNGNMKSNLVKENKSIIFYSNFFNLIQCKWSEVRSKIDKEKVELRCKFHLQYWAIGSLTLKASF